MFALHDEKRASSLQRGSALQTSMSRALTPLCITAFGLPVIGLVLPRPVLQAAMESFPLQQVANLVPAVGVLSAVSADPIYYQFVIAVQWLVVPLYVVAFCCATRLLERGKAMETLKRFFRGPRYTFKAAAGHTLLALMTISDVFHLQYPSFFWGDALTAYHDKGIFLAINSSRVCGLATYFSMGLIDGFNYFTLVLIAAAGWDGLQRLWRPSSR
jgi:hypothetical protein